MNASANEVFSGCYELIGTMFQSLMTEIYNFLPFLLPVALLLFLLIVIGIFKWVI